MSPRPVIAFLVAIAIIGLLGYGLFEARRLIEGPVITIFSPKHGTATSTTGLLIEGVAQNISFLTINDKPSFTDEEGRFVELLSPPPGFTVINVSATDRFGRRTSKSVSIHVLSYCPLHIS